MVRDTCRGAFKDTSSLLVLETVSHQGTRHSSLLEVSFPSFGTAHEVRPFLGAKGAGTSHPDSEDLLVNAVVQLSRIT